MRWQQLVGVLGALVAGACGGADVHAPSSGVARSLAACEAHRSVPASGATPHQVLDSRHTKPVVGLAFSPDGHLLASAAKDGTLRIWDVANRDLLRVMHRVGEATSVAWADGGRVLVRDEGPDPVLYDVGAGQVARAFEGVGFTRSLGRAPATSGGAWVATAYRRVTVLGEAKQKIYDFELPTGERLGDSRDVLAWSADHATVGAAYAKDAIVVRGVGKEDAERTIAVPGIDWVERLALSPSGDRAVVVASKGGWSRVAVVATAKGAVPEELPWPSAVGLRRADGTSNGGGPPVTDVAATARLAAVATTTAGLFVWDLGAKKLAWSREVPPEPGVPLRDRDYAERVAFSPDGTLVAHGTMSGRVLVYSAASGRFVGELGTKSRSAVDLAFQDPTHLALLATDALTHRSNVSVWALDRAELASDKASVNAEAMAVTPGGAIAEMLAPEDAACAAGFVRTVEGLDRGVQRACSPGATSFDPWLLKTEMNARTATALVPLGINPRGVLDLRTGAVVRLAQSETPQALVQRAALSPDGAWVVGHTVDTIFEWDAHTGQVARTIPVATLVQGAGVPTAVAFSGDARAFVVAVPQFASPNTFLVTFDSATGAVVGQAALSGLVTAVAFGASTSELVVGGLGAKRGAVVVVRDGKIVAASKEDADFPWKLVVDPSHKVAATLSQDGGVRVWDLETAALRATLAEFDDGEWLAATPGGAYTGTPEVGARLGWLFEAPLERFGFEQFSAGFRDAYVVRRRLAGEAVDAAVRPERPPTVAFVAPPETGTLTQLTTATLKVHASSSDRVDVVRVFADGRPVAEAPVCAKDGDATVQVPLLGGINRVTAVAFDAKGFASNEASVDLEAPRTGRPTPEVWVVAAGVARYPNLKDSDLDVTVDDARSVGAAFAAQSGPGRTFARSHVKVLADDQVTPASLEAAVRELSAMHPEDVAIVFFAGHGMKLPHDGDMVLATSSARFVGGKPEGFVGWKTIGAALAAAKGRALVLLDACHAGHVSQELVVQNGALAHDLVRAQRAGAVVLAAAKGREESLETDSVEGALRDLVVVHSDPAAPGHAPEHGLLTGALLRSLESVTTDANEDHAIQLSELVRDVTLRVSRASRGRQTPWVARRELFGDFVIAATPAAAR